MEEDSQSYASHQARPVLIRKARILTRTIVVTPRIAVRSSCSILTGKRRFKPRRFQKEAEELHERNSQLYRFGDVGRGGNFCGAAAAATRRRDGGCSREEGCPEK